MVPASLPALAQCQSFQKRVARVGPAVPAVEEALEMLRQDIASALPPTGILAGAFVGRLAKSDQADDATRSVQALVDKLQSRCAPLPYTITVHVQQADAVNAAALPGGGPVPDYVHFHKIRFQMIYCAKGWVRVSYEDQGEPFVVRPGY